MTRQFTTKKDIRAGHSSDFTLRKIFKGQMFAAEIQSRANHNVKLITTLDLKEAEALYNFLKPNFDKQPKPLKKEKSK